MFLTVISTFARTSGAALTARAKNEKWDPPPLQIKKILPKHCQTRTCTCGQALSLAGHRRSRSLSQQGQESRYLGALTPQLVHGGSHARKLHLLRHVEVGVLQLPPAKRPLPC